MVKLALFSLQILIPIYIVLSKDVSFEPELKFIGSFRSRSSSRTGSTQLYDESNYYVSQNAGAWNSAVIDCKNVLGANATLVSIEYEEEWEFLKDILEYYGFATTYWTCGTYDPSRTLWRWTANNVALPPSAPWDTQYPSSPNTLLRVLIYFGNRYNAYWRTISNTQLHRYICEVQLPTIAQPCYKINDLAIVLDSSGSIGIDNFEKAKEFVERLANAFTVFSASRLTFITYSFYTTERIPLTHTLSRGAISSAIMATPWEAGGTATDLGINMATAVLASHSRGVPLNMVVLTDGQSNNPTETVLAAEMAIRMGIRTFSVGITPSIDAQELLAIAGNDPSRVFTTANFDDLINLLAPLSLKVCP